MITDSAVRRLNGSYGGRVRDEAYLELAQEHFLHWMQSEGLIVGEQVIFKGGTSLRKFVFGHTGRFSVDLDFSISHQHYAEYVLDALATGFTHEGVSFDVSDRVDVDAMKTAWRATTPQLGETRLQSRLDFSTRELLHPPESRARATIVSVDETTLGFAPVVMPLASLAETAAEKLARYRRVIFARDLYDLFHLIPLVRDYRDLIKDILFFKVWGDVVDDDRGTKPFLGGHEYRGHTVNDVRGLEEIGVLTINSLNVPHMLALIEDTFAVMGSPIGEQQETLARCQSRDRFRVQQWSDELRAKFILNQAS